MNSIKFNRVWQIIYPLFVYYIFYNIAFSLFNDFLGEKTGELFCLMLAGLITLVPIYVIYRKIPKFFPEKLTGLKDYFIALSYIAVIVITGIVLNVLITQTGLYNGSSGFKEAQSTLSDGTLVIKILCNCIIIPILEEMLYRGIVLGQLLRWVNPIIAIGISAFCFGFLHFNIVQFLYAFIVGLALGFAFYKSKRLNLVILAHGLTNLIVILFT